MNPQTDTPESAEAMKNEARKITIGSATGTLFIDGKPTGTEIKIYNERGITREELLALLNPAQQSDTALKLQRCEEALRGMEALATGEGWNTPIFSAPFRAALREARAALTHPTRNEGEKKV